MSPEGSAVTVEKTATRTKPVVEQTRVEGCLSYLVYDPATKDAVVIDPRFDAVDKILQRVKESGLRLRCALDTHAHADHVSGVARLAAETGAQAIVSDTVGFPARLVKDGDRIDAGSFGLDVIATPGHTSDSISFRMGDVVFTGDALLIGSAGRTDFQNGSPQSLFQTFETKLRGLPPATIVYPGHDYKGRTHSTIGDELAANPLFGQKDQGAFVTRLTGSRQPEPANMGFVLATNRAGAKSSVTTIDPAGLKGRLEAGEPLQLIDVRTLPEFATYRIRGARNIPLPQVPASTGSIAPTQPVVLICEAGVRATMAATAFAGRSGVWVLTGGMAAWRAAGFPTEGAGGGVWPIERQVRFVIGVMVLLGTVLGFLVDRWFLGITAFFGCGLVFSAVTGKCGMAVMLAKLPWNKNVAASCAPGAAPAGGNGAAGGGGGGGGCAAG